MHQHAVIFIDHHEAHVLFPTAPTATEREGGHVVEHRVDKTKDGHHHPLDHRDLAQVADKVRGVSEILIAGPSTAKHELKRFFDEHHADIAKKVVGVVALDHPTSGELKDIARAHFKQVDLWR